MTTADLGQEGNSKEGRPCGITEDFWRRGQGKRCGATIGIKGV